MVNPAPTAVPLSQLALDHLPLVGYAVSEIAPRTEGQRDDLAAAGVLGLLQASGAHDSGQAPFAPLAKARIRNALITELVSSDWQDRARQLGIDPDSVTRVAHGLVAGQGPDYGAVVLSGLAGDAQAAPAAGAKPAPVVKRSASHYAAASTASDHRHLHSAGAPVHVEPQGQAGLGA